MREPRSHADFVGDIYDAHVFSGIGPAPSVL
jgi:hypothetical protein